METYKLWCRTYNTIWYYNNYIITQNVQFSLKNARTYSIERFYCFKITFYPLFDLVISCSYVRIRMSASTSSKNYTSTPLKIKSTIPQNLHRSRSLDSTRDSIYSLLSPIYHDSFDPSDEENKEAQKEHQSAEYPSSAVHEDILTPSMYVLFITLLACCTKIKQIIVWDVIS